MDVDKLQLYTGQEFMHITIIKGKATRLLPVKKGINSLLVLSTPNAKAMVESFLMEFSRSYKMYTESQVSTKLDRRRLETRA